MLFKKLFKSKGTIKDTKDYTDCTIELVYCTHYLKTLYMIKNNIYDINVNINNDIENLKDYLKYTQFYFYLSVEPNLYDKLLEFLSKTHFISSVVDNRINVLIKLNGEEIIEVFNSDDIRNIIYKKFRESLMLINKVYFESLINKGILSERDFLNNDEMDKENNDKYYQSIIGRFNDNIQILDNITLISEKTQIFYNKKLLDLFGEYKLFSFITPPILLLDDGKIYQFNSIKELYNNDYKNEIINILQSLYPYNINKLLVNQYETHSIISEEYYIEEIIE